MHKKRLSAFTIMEMVIAMLLAAIVIGMVYSTHNIISHTWLGFRSKNTRLAELSRVDELLRRDFLQSEYIVQSDDTLVFSGPQQRTRYLFQGAQIIRLSGISDTFKTHIMPIELHFLPPTPGMNDTIPREPLTDDLQLTIFSLNDTLRFHYHKNYSSVNLINYNTYARH